jgi:hypothetical protein
VDEIRSFLMEQAAGHPSPVNQQILQLKDNQILMLARNLVDNTRTRKDGEDETVITLQDRVEQGIGCITETLSQQLKEKRSTSNQNRPSGTHTLQLHNSKLASRAQSPIVAIQKFESRRKTKGAVTQTMTQESEVNSVNDLRVANDYAEMPTSARGGNGRLLVL